MVGVAGAEHRPAPAATVGGHAVAVEDGVAAVDGGVVKATLRALSPAQPRILAGALRPLPPRQSERDVGRAAQTQLPLPEG